MRGKTPRQKLLTDLAAAYHLAVTEKESFIWEAYGQKIKEAVLRRVRFNIEPDPEDTEMCRKYNKQIQLAMLKLHAEVQQYYKEQR